MVSPFQELSANFWPMVPEGLEEFVKGDAIGTRGPFVGFDVLPSTLNVSVVNNCFHQRK